MKWTVTPMLAAPEPSISPFRTLFFALLAAAGVSSMTALILMGI
jgi:hypothetical protein